MNIAYIEPLGRAWTRMKLALFKPFDLHKWFVVGFSAFLAGLAEGPRGSGSSGARGVGDLSFREFLDLPNKAWEWLMSHPGWFALILFIIGVITVVVITLTWLSSRGNFMFLDNVVHDKAEIAKPWKHYRTEGNSLFLWRVGFGFICLALFIMFIVFFFATASHLYEGGFYQRVPIGFIVGMAFLFFFMIIIVGYISMFLKNFVVPIMYKNNITATRGWGRFLSLFSQHPFHFILYGLFVLGLTILVGIIIILAGLLTCLIGFVVLIIPYIGIVATLPIWYTYRAFSLEYLAQFGPEYELFPPTEGSAVKAKA
ncbi:MAG: hypothetical protein GTO17_11910 [Candidatus Aminicenantes bacterium]|nr:hypothetical protein [Candidatus Aminicenantes bacterium]